MSQNSSAGAFQGFSVYQPSLGAPLQWLPALGTQDLDDMVTAFLPGPASIQDKRAHISMDFFEYARQTGQNFKFYPVTAASLAASTDSPTSTAMYDSGYNSGFNTSPVVSDLGSWTHSPVAISGASEQSRSKSGTAARRPAGSSSRQQVGDFSGHPGMRIMTKDGLDVTNSASRGSKTKEQRDHAHLMRIIKACDSCKRKKTRCDPSHKKRSASQASQSSQTEPKPTKKTKKTSASAALAVPLVDSSFIISEFSFDSDDTPAPFSFEDSCESLDDLWNKFVHLEPESFVVSHTAPPQQDDYDFFFDPQGHFTPSSGSSATSPSQVFTPFSPSATRTSPASLAQTGPEGVDPSPGEPSLPYLNPSGAHGTNYIDFNLYSPASDFLDDDLQPVHKKSVSPVRQSAESPSPITTRIYEEPGPGAPLDSSGRFVVPDVADLIPDVSPEMAISRHQQGDDDGHARASQPDCELHKSDYRLGALRPQDEKHDAALHRERPLLVEASSRSGVSGHSVSSSGLSVQAAESSLSVISTASSDHLPTLLRTELPSERGAISSRDGIPKILQTTASAATLALVSADAQTTLSASAGTTYPAAIEDFGSRSTASDPLDTEPRLYSQGSGSASSVMSRRTPSAASRGSQPSGPLPTMTLPHAPQMSLWTASPAVLQSTEVSRDVGSSSRPESLYTAISALRPRRQTTKVSREQSYSHSHERRDARARDVAVHEKESQISSHLPSAVAVSESIICQAHLTVSTESAVTCGSLTQSSAMCLLLATTLALGISTVFNVLGNKARPSGEAGRASSLFPVALGLFACGLVSSLAIAASHSQYSVFLGLPNTIPTTIGFFVALCTVRAESFRLPSAGAFLRAPDTFRCSVAKLAERARFGRRRGGLGPVRLGRLSGVRL